jgi:hypothetical protein
MKDIFRILDNSKKANYQKTLSLSSSEYPSSEWQALNLIESSASLMLNRISSATPKGYTHKITQVKLELFKPPGDGEKLYIKSQLYPLDKKLYLLKVFAHEIDHRNKALKLAKASYHIKIEDVRTKRVA